MTTPQTVNLISCQEGASSHPLCTSHLSFLRLRVLQPLVWFWSVARACGRCAFQVLNISHSIQDILQPCHVAASVLGKTESAIRVEALAIPSLNLIHPCSIIYFLYISIISSCVLHPKSNSAGAPYSNRNQLGRLSFQALPDHLASGIRWASTQIMLSSCRCERIRQKLAFNERDWVGTSRGWLVQYCPGSNLLNLALSEHGVPWKCHRRYFIAGKQMFSILNHWTWIPCFQTEHLLPQKTESYVASDAAVPSWHSSCSKITPGIQAGPNNRCPTPSERSTHEHHWIYIVYIYKHANLLFMCKWHRPTLYKSPSYFIQRSGIRDNYKQVSRLLMTFRPPPEWLPAHQGRRIPAIICHPILRQPFE